MKRATTSATEALQGKIAGVSVLKSGGNAGASISVKIRGIKTMGDNEPLYIIDGYPGDINTINPQDIGSQEVRHAQCRRLLESAQHDVRECRNKQARLSYVQEWTEPYRCRYKLAG